jgi:hypothetical protein
MLFELKNKNNIQSYQNLINLKHIDSLYPLSHSYYVGKYVGTWFFFGGATFSSSVAYFRNSTSNNIIYVVKILPSFCKRVLIFLILSMKLLQNELDN